MYRKLFLTTLLFALTLSVAVAQTDRGTITGTIVDSSGASVPGATVTVTNTATNSASSAVTSSDGLYTIPSLPPGTYKVRVEKTGFKASEIAQVALSAGSNSTANMTLTVGQVSDTVEISSALGAQLQTENAKTSSQISNKQIDQLPLVVSGTMRSAFDLSALTPEAKNIGLGGNAGTQGPGYTSQYSIGGGQGGSWGVTLDGASAGTGRFGSTEWANLNTPSIDAITEFAVDTNGFKAEFGRAQGGIMSFSSRSGTNSYHGNAYEFLRNNAFDARNYFEVTRSVLKQHDFGGTFGGPVRIPWLYNGKDKTFFFVSAELFKNRAGANSFLASVPTPEMYTGDFSKWVDKDGKPLTIYDPTIVTVNGVATRNPFPGNKIPSNRFSPLALKYLAHVGTSLAPNAAGAPGTFGYVNLNYRSLAGSSLFPWTKWSVKLDHNFSEKHKLSGLFNYGLSEVLPGVDGYPRLPGTVTDFRATDQSSYVYRGNYTWTVSNNIVNYAYGGVNWWKQLNYTPTAVGGWKAKGICLPGSFDCDFNLLQVNFNDGFQTGNYYPWSGSAGDGSENPVFTVGDDVTYIKGRHTIKGGYLFEQIHYNGFGRQTISGRVNFDRRSTSIPGSNDLSTGGGNSFASFLLGEVFSAGTENNRFVRQRWRSHSTYIQDDWKITPKLTMNFGLRYEFTLPPLERDDKWSDFDPGLPNPLAGGRLGALKFAGFEAGEVGKRTLVPGWFGGLGPRLSFAYSPNDKTVIRAGVGRSFGVVRTISGSTHFFGAIQIYNTGDSPNTIDRVFKLDDGFIVNGVNTVPQPPSTNPGFNVNSNVAWWQGKEVSRLPENWNWTLSMQRQLPKNFLFEATYNASVGVHLVAGLLNVNQLNSKYLSDPKIQPILGARIDSPAAAAAGVIKPYASFPDNFPVWRALRPFPQYTDVDTWGGNGDRSGHSTYHSLILKMDRKVSNGVYLQGSYVWSKLIGDSDLVDGSGRARDQYNRRLEKSVSQLDLPHNFKFSYIYELPFGKGKKFLSEGLAANLIGGWRFTGIHIYSSGQPIQLNSNVNYNLGTGSTFAYVNTLDNWVASKPDNPNYRATSGYTSYFTPVCQIVTCNASGGVLQPNNLIGNAPRFNGKARRDANLNENISLQKTFSFTETVRLDFRWEMFNVLNRVVFGAPDSNVQSQTFGRITSQFNSPRQMQFGLKLYF